MKVDRDLIGVPYKIHGRTLDGLDCYGLAIEFLKRNGLELKDVFYEKEQDYEQARENVFEHLEVQKVDKLDECCIIEITCYGVPSHIGIYIGDGQMLHTTKSTGSCIVPLHLYQNRIRGIYKVINTRL